MAEFEDGTEQPPTALEWLAKRRKPKKVKPVLQPRKVSIKIEGNGASGSLNVAALISKLLDEAGVFHAIEFDAYVTRQRTDTDESLERRRANGAARQEQAFAEIKEGQSVEELADFANRRDEINLHHGTIK